MALRKTTLLIAIHVTATRPSQDIGVKEVDAMHRALGWNGCGYQYVLRRDGAIELGRGKNDVGSHVAGFNSISIGISLAGGLDASGKPANTATPEQMASLEQLLRQLTKEYPDAKICGHRDLSPDLNGNGYIEPSEHLKACPCFDVIPWARSKGLPAADIKGVWDKSPVTIPAAAGAPAATVNGPDARNVYLQKLLERAGYRFGAIDGLIGPKTKAAIKQFQIWADLAQSGEFDAATVALLRATFETAKAA